MTTMMTTTTYTTVQESPGLHCYRLVRSRWHSALHCVLVDYDQGQVYDAMPGDRPAEGGQWCARISDRGISYVAGLYSEPYARQVYRRLAGVSP